LNLCRSPFSIVLSRRRLTPLDDGNSVAGLVGNSPPARADGVVGGGEVAQRADGATIAAFAESEGAPEAYLRQWVTEAGDESSDNAAMALIAGVGAESAPAAEAALQEPS
jgi:hypothetical protein